MYLYADTLSSSNSVSVAYICRLLSALYKFSFIIHIGEGRGLEAIAPYPNVERHLVVSTHEKQQSYKNITFELLLHSTQQDKFTTSCRIDVALDRTYYIHRFFNDTLRKWLVTIQPQQFDEWHAGCTKRQEKHRKITQMYLFLKKAEHLYSGVLTTLKRSGMDHTV